MEFAGRRVRLILLTQEEFSGLLSCLIGRRSVAMGQSRRIPDDAKVVGWGFPEEPTPEVMLYVAIESEEFDVLAAGAEPPIHPHLFLFPGAVGFQVDGAARH